MKKYLRIYRTFLFSSLVREMEFRANFFAKVILAVTWTFFFIIAVLIIFQNTQSIGGWNQGEVLVLTGSAFLISSFHQGFCNSLIEIPTQVQLGTLDFVVTRPIESQFWVSFRKFNLDQIGTMITSSIMIGVGLAQAHSITNVTRWSEWLYLMICAFIVFYSFNLAIFTSSIWFVKMDNLFVIPETILSVSRNPMEIFSKAAQKIFIYACPLAFLAYMPSVALVKELNPIYLIYSALWAILFFAGSRAFWKFASRYYSSASA